MQTYKSMKRFFLFFLLIPFLFDCSCHRKDPVYPTYYMDQEFKDYCVFPVGSYWVYEDSLSGSIDSVYLYRQDYVMDNTTNAVAFNFENFTRYMFSSYYNDTLFGSGGADHYPYNNSCSFSERYLSNYGHINNIFFSNKDTGTIYQSNQNIYIQYTCFYDSLSFTAFFKKVKVFKNLQQEAPDLPEKIYHARNVGVIRRELFNGQVWNLIRYHIN
jgi:hypothetical protein